MSRLVKNIVYNILGQGMLMVVGLVSVKYVFKQLGDEALGIISFTLTLNVLLTGILAKGVYSTTIREVSSNLNSRPEYVHSFIQTASAFTWSIFLFFVVLVYFGAPFLVEKWIILKELDFQTTVLLLRVLGIASLGVFPRSFYASILTGMQRMEYNALIDVGISVIQQVGIIVILAFKGNLLFVACWIAVCYGLGILVYLTAVKRFFSFRVLIPIYSHSVVKRVSKFASKMISVSVLAVIQNQAEKVIMSSMLSIGVFGYYNSAYNLVSKTGIVTGAISQVAYPSFSALAGSTDREKMILQYEKLQDLVCYITVPIFMAVLFLALPLFGYVFTDAIADSLMIPVVFLSLGFYLNGTLNVPYQFSLASGKPEISVRSNLYALFILPITALLIYKFGLKGAGISWVLFNLFVYIYAVPRICRECIGISPKIWYVHILRVMALASLTYGPPWLLIKMLGIYSVVPLGLAYLLGTVLFLLGAYFLIGPVLRSSLPDVVKKRMEKLLVQKTLKR
jgi:O-antigen/teichoic acid export membrane protein